MSSRGPSVPLKYPYFPPNQDPNEFTKDDYKNHPLLKYSLAKEKRKEVQKLVQRQADRNRAKVLERLQKRKQKGGTDKRSSNSSKSPQLSQEECLASLRKFVGMAPIAGIQKQTLVNITKLLPAKQKTRYPAALAILLDEVKAHYSENLREGTINMMIRNPELEAIQAEAIKKDVKDTEAPWHKEFKKNQRRILINLHVLHPALRQCLSICKYHLDTTTMANCEGFRGEAIDLDSFCGNIISECEKTEEHLLHTWFPKITAVFTDKKVHIKHKGERLSRFYRCASSLVSIQLRNLLTRSILGYVDVFADHRKLPRIEMELILQGSKICFSPTMQEVCDMIVSVVHEMNKLLREVPTIESWISDSSSEFVQVSLHKDFITSALEKLKVSINKWLVEPQEFCNDIIKRFDFLIDGTASKAIRKFISTDPKFEDICNELQVYNRYVEQTQEITSLEYFTFIRLDCEKIRKGLGDAARDLANSLLQNVVDTYRKENETICAAFEEIERVALNAPKSTKEMIELGEYMLHVKNKKMLQLTEEIERSKKHLLYIIDVHIFSQEDIERNTKTLGWPVKIKPVFEQNTEIVEDCKARFEDNLSKKSEWISKELEKLSARVQELEELGEIASVQQYTYEVRMIQNKLKSIEDTIIWINHEEALFKFPQSSYPDVGDMTTIQSGEGKMKSNIDPYARLFTTVLKWQKAEKKWTDGSFLELNAEQIESDINAFSKEMEDLQKLFKSKFKQQALDGDSKYAKMNLEDSNPNNLPPPLRICALTIVQIKEFRKNIPIIVCLCNPGIRQRHWNQMGDVIGFDITPNSGSSLRKVLRLDLGDFMPKLEAISIAATREHALELTLQDMKNEWKQVNFKTLEYRNGETDYKILDSVESIKDHLDDHLLKTQIMRGSPYFKAFEVEVKKWEFQLDRVQTVLHLWQRVQEHWLYLEPIYTTEDIANQMETESRLFKDVDRTFKNIIEMADTNPNVIHITETNGVLDMLTKSDKTVKDIIYGLEGYLRKKCLSFPRLFFLSRQEILALLCQTRDPTKAQEHLRLCFSGIHSLEFDELQEIQSMQSPKGERIPFPAPIRTRDARGCVEKWMIQVEESMRAAVRDIIDGALETIESSSRSEWVQEWPVQAILVAAFITATSQCQEAIKGGTGALKDLELKYKKYNEEIIEVSDDSIDNATQEVLSSIMIHDIYTRETIDCLIHDQVVSEKDYAWRSRPKCYYVVDGGMGDIFVEMLNFREKYYYEYLGDCVHQVWNRSFEKSMYTFLTAYTMKSFPLIQGPSSSGKHVLVQEVARMLAQNLIDRPITPMTGPERVIQFFKGAAYSGAWLCCSTIDRLREEFLSALVPWLQAISSTLKRIKKKKSSGKAILPDGESLVISAKAFLCFTTSPKYLGRNDLPINMQETMRPIALLKIDKVGVLNVLLKSFGITASHLPSYMVEQSDLCSSLLSTPKSLDMRQLQYVVTQIRKAKNETDESNEAIVKSLIERVQSGSLYSRDNATAKDIGDVIWNTSKAKLDEDNYEDIKDVMNKAQDELEIHVHDGLPKKTQSFLINMSRSRATMLCGPSFSGKSTIISAAIHYEQKINKKKLTSVRVHPKTCSPRQLYGWFSDDGFHTWNDGLLTKYLRANAKNDSEFWLIADAHIDYKWAETMESLMTTGMLTLHSGEELKLSNQTKVVFETNQINDVSPGFISKCGLVITEKNELNWTVFLDDWNRKTLEDQTVMKWRRGQDELITGLFNWLVPPLISLVRFKCNSVIHPMPNALARYMLEFFTSTLSEAISNLKERKYLRAWIQAACITSATWTIGGILKGKDRQLFDSKLRDILLGRSSEDPLPPALNNKFDAIPPAEGLVYDFVFEFKARGQWKQWSDVVKNVEMPETLTPLTLIPTVDTARFFHIYALSLRCKKPLLLIGPPGIGKSKVIWSKIRSNTDIASYKYTALPNSSPEELKTWLIGKLSKRGKGVYGPDTTTGNIFIDDLTSPHPDEFGDVSLHEQIIELIDSSSWYDIESGSYKCKLEDVNLTFAATLEFGVFSVLSDRLLSRVNFALMAHPSEESFMKIFSTNLALRFKEQNYPPEVSGVIPSIIQSTHKVYTECRSVLLEDPVVQGRSHVPDLRDVQRVIHGCSALPKEAAENKKLFTRLWVHEALRNFYDRLLLPKEMDAVFQCIRNCVKSIFRENFDSAFEHLGKVDGQVTQLNLRNLLFGQYLPSDQTGSRSQKDHDHHPLVEITTFDQVEKVVISKVKEHNDVRGFNEIYIIPIRYSLEIVSHIHRVISTDGGHMVIGGNGGEGRTTMARIAATLNDHVFFTLPISLQYGEEDWRKDLRRLIKLAGSENRHVVLFLQASQLLKHDFLRGDVDSLYARGEIPDLFSEEEKHQLNEVVHKYLMKVEGGKVSEMTPSALYEIFIDISRVKIHVIINYDHNDENAKRMLRMHKSIFTESTQLNLKTWPDDALKKSADIMFEEVNADRNAKKVVTGIGQNIYQEAINFSMEDVVSKLTPDILVSPSMYIHFITTLSKEYCNHFSRIEEKRNRFEKVIQRMENIVKQVDELQQELSDLQPRFQQMSGEIETKKETVSELQAQRSSNMTQYKLTESKLSELKNNLDQSQITYDDAMAPDNDKVSSLNMSLNTIKTTDVPLMKTLKATPSSIKLAFGAMCVILGIGPEKIPEAQSKKNRKEKKAGEPSDGSEYWVPSKKVVFDPTFPEKLCTIDFEEVTKEKVATVTANFLTHPEWDPVSAGKILTLAEIIAKWVVAIKDHHLKRTELIPQHEKLEELKVEYASESEKSAEKWKQLENDEQKLEELKESLEKIEHEKAQINQDKVACRDKLEKGKKLMDELAGECVSWKEKLSCINEELENLLGDMLIYAAIICILPAFGYDTRHTLKRFMMEKLKEHTISYSKCSSQNDNDEDNDEFDHIIDKTALEQWRLSGLPSDTFFTENAIAIQESANWPLILDQNGRALYWLKTLYKDRTVKILQDNDEELLQIVKKSIINGDILILYDEACLYDSRLESLYKRRYIKNSTNETTSSINEASEHIAIEIDNEVIPYSSQFRLYIISRSASPEHNLQTRCCLVNYNFTKSSLNEYFLDTIFEREKPAKRQEYLLICGREIEALSSSKRHRSKIQMLLSETEGNILDNPNLTSNLLELRKELSKSDDRYSGMRDMKKDLRTASLQYISAAKHATILYITIQQLIRICHMYQYSFEWFTRVFKSSIENSNKSNHIEKRLRYLKDHLTYSLYCQVSYSLQKEDCLIFAFLLCCKLMINEDRIPEKALDQLVELWKVVTLDEKIIACQRKLSEEIENKPPILNWLSNNSWMFMNEYCKHFEECDGFITDLAENNAKWKLLFDAKEPDNLPFHEPWYSRLNRFHKLVICAVLRVDKLPELVESFVSDHIGYKFVEPVQFDLGRIFSETDPSQPLLYTVKGPNEAASDIKKFAEEKEKSLAQFSMGGNNEIAIKQMIFKTLESGEKWILLENFQNAHDMRSMLKHHVKIEQDFNPSYRLWIVTSETNRFPSAELKQCLKLTSEQPFTLRDSIIISFTKGSIKEAKCWSGDRQSIIGNERHISRLLFCLAFFHASINERCKYRKLGGWSTFPVFSSQELALGVNFLELMSREFDPIPYEGLVDLVGDSAYSNLFLDTHDRGLLGYILDTCINEKAVTTNRYRFSNIPTDFFVPNKTLYKDYIEFIKGLPLKSDYEALDLEYSCQILSDKLRGTELLLKLYYAIRNGDPYTKTDVVETLEKLLKCVSEALVAHDSFPYLDDGPLKWLWINEMTRHDIILDDAFARLDKLNKCVRGDKVLDDHSKDLATVLADGQVPKNWLGEDKTNFSLTAINFIQIINQRTEFFRGLNELKIIPIDVVVKPLRLLTALKFNFAKVQKVNFQDVDFQANFYDTEEKCLDAKNSSDIEGYGFTKLVLVGAKWDYNKQSLVEKNMMHEHETPLPYALLTPTLKTNLDSMIKCPLYANTNRTSIKKSSSFLCYIPVQSDIVEHLVFKKGIMLAIDDQNRN